MKSDFEKELDNNRLTIVRHGFLIMLMMILFLGSGLMLLKIDNQSVLEMVINYLSHNHE
jgi:hypothetical protein